SCATWLVPARGSSEPMVLSVPTVSRSGASAAACVDANRTATSKRPANAATRLRTPRPESRAVVQDLARRVQAGDARDAAAAVGRAARLVETGDRRAEVGGSRRGAH